MEMAEGILHQRNYRCVDKDALRTHVPYITPELGEALSVLHDLEERLPAIRTQATHVRNLYDSSREKVLHFPPIHFLYIT